MGLNMLVRLSEIPPQIVEAFSYPSLLVIPGEYALGRRNGHGILRYPSGLVYEGNFQDNKPHGRGTMTSKLTGWAYEGNFEK